MMFILAVRLEPYAARNGPETGSSQTQKRPLNLHKSLHTFLLFATICVLLCRDCANCSNMPRGVRTFGLEPGPAHPPCFRFHTCCSIFVDPVPPSIYNGH